MTPPDQPRDRMTLETLLRLKRAERPDPAFWAEWDAELRRRQLASAIVVPEPWYRKLFTGWRPAVAASASAAAVIAVLFSLPVRTVHVLPEHDVVEPVVAALVAGESLAAPVAEPEVFAEASFVLDVLTKPIAETAPRRFSTLAAVETLRSEPVDSAQYADYTLKHLAQGSRF